MTFEFDWESSRKYERENFAVQCKAVNDNEPWGNALVLEVANNGRQFMCIAINNKAEYNAIMAELRKFKNFKFDH